MEQSTSLEVKSRSARQETPYYATGM